MEGLMQGKLVEFSSNGDLCHGYLSVPVKGTGPGVIVLQEWWGLVDHIKDVADRFSREGFVALAPDLYHGATTTVPDEAAKMFMALNIHQFEKDLQGAIQCLLSLGAVTGTKVATVGFCMGGQLSLLAACSNSSVGACVDYYGIHPNVHPDLNSLKAPVLGFFGERDSSVKPETVHKLENELRRLGKQVEFHVFPGANHAFFNDTRPEVFHSGYASESWERMIRFLKDHV